MNCEFNIKFISGKPQTAKALTSTSNSSTSTTPATTEDVQSSVSNSTNTTDDKMGTL